MVGEARGELFENLMVVGRSSDEEVEGKQVLLIHWDKSTVRDKGWMVVFARRAVSKQWQHQGYPPICPTRGGRVSRVWFYRFGRSCSSISPGNQAAVHFWGGKAKRRSKGDRKRGERREMQTRSRVSEGRVLAQRQSRSWTFERTRNISKQAAVR